MWICRWCTSQGKIWKKNWESSWSDLDEENLQEDEVGEVSKSLTMYSVNLGFILEGIGNSWIVLRASLMCGAISFISFGQFLLTVSTSVSSAPFSSSYPTVTPTKYILDHLILSHISRTFYSVLGFFPPFISFPLCGSVWIISIDLSSNSLILSSPVSSHVVKHIKWILYFWYCSFQLYNFHLILL